MGQGWGKARIRARARIGVRIRARIRARARVRAKLFFVKWPSGGVCVYTDKEAIQKITDRL